MAAKTNSEERFSIWIQDDLHAGNFGADMNSADMFVFEINDFDESSSESLR